MKKLTSIVVATVLAAAIGNVYAADETSCPSVWDLRDHGSTFTHAFRDSASSNGKNADMWLIFSEPFSLEADVWQTVYVANMPGITDPQSAVEKGQHDYNYSALMTKPEVSTFGTSIQCRYSPEGSRYAVFAVNEIVSGFKKFR